MLDGLMIYTSPRCRTIKPRKRLAGLVKQSVLRLIASAG
jgi:hypothetical protein